jgi:hypothetical protein
MWQWLAQLQAKPKSYRQRVAFTSAVTVTSMIALLWVVSLPERLAQLTTDLAEPVAVDDAEVSGFLAGVREQVAAVGASLSALRDTAETEPASSATSTATSSAPAASSSVGLQIPTLATTTIRQLNPRPIRIATTSQSEL